MHMYILLVFKKNILQDLFQLDRLKLKDSINLCRSKYIQCKLLFFSFWLFYQALYLILYAMNKISELINRLIDKYFILYRLT